MRTYNFPQSRITDHRSSWECTTAAAFMNGVGPIEELHEHCIKRYRVVLLRRALDKAAKELLAYAAAAAAAAAKK
jgi:protein subunit release factor A